MEKKFKVTKAFRFRHYCRGAYAVFNSLHREVNIGHVASYIADRQLQKSVATVALGLFLVQGQQAMAQDDIESETILPEVEVSMAADSLLFADPPEVVLTNHDFKHTSVRTIGDLIALLPGVDLRVRGGSDVQADLSMRGGTFDQMVLLINGVNFTDAQTGHHTLDLPLDIAMVQRVELLSPSQLMARGIVSFCGGVNIVVDEEYRNHLIAEVSGGSFGTANASFIASHVYGKWALTAAAAYHRSDGYMQNTDYRHGSLFLQVASHCTKDDWHIQLGGQMKGFGSQAFYSTKYPDQYEATKTLTASVMNVHRWSQARMETAIYGRLHRDRFELFREGYVDAPTWYTGHNHHLSSLSGVKNRIVSRLGAGEILAGVEIRREGIWSNVLGLPENTLREPFTKSASRIGTSIFGGYHIEKGRWDGEVVALGMYNTAFGFNYGFTANASYKVSGRFSLNAYVSRTYRLPSFTDLYYRSVTQQSNPDLNAESSNAAELSAIYSDRVTHISASAYYRAGSEIIDWVRSPEETVWHSMNHSNVDAFGVDFHFRRRIKMFSFGANYSYCNIAQDAGEMISNYALEYLRHKAMLFISVEPMEHLFLKIDGNYRYREGQYTDAEGNICQYGGVVILNARVEYQFPKFTIYIEGHNFTDRHYRDHGGVPQPGLMLLGGISVGR